jgi:2-polyprenyl-6-methoxyphenol hydroxylase-like FAD-dependent oxidoreductase
MPNTIGEQAVVIGAGMGGLSAAKAVAPFFERVVVLDRDALPDAPAPRIGTPQARHAHALLAGGLRALEQLFPGFGDDLAKAGAVTVRAGRDVIWERPGYDPFPIRDLGFDVFSMSRPLLETVCRRRLEAESNVELRSRTRAAEIIAAPGRDRVAAVQVENGSTAPERIPADLVIDASGRAGPTLAIFDAMGAQRPDETEIGIDIGYATAIFDVPDPAPDWKGLTHIPAPPKEMRAAVVLPIENRRWIVSIGGRHGDDPPGDLDGFLAFTKTFRTPTIHDAIARAKLVGDIARYNLPASVRRHFEKLPKPPRGLIPIGDSVCRFNPIFGQGMSVAAQEAVVLRNLLESRRDRADPLDDLAKPYFADIQECLASPWSTALTDFIHPATRGERPPDLENRLRYGAALLRLAAQDPEVHKLMAEVTSLTKPAGALREPALADRVMALMAAA